MRIDKMQTYADYKKLSTEEKVLLFDEHHYGYGEVVKYFGGKAAFRSVLMRTIVNVASNAYDNTANESENAKKPIFIDAFTGGGKIALCAPKGLFSQIVMNDLDSSMYTLYRVIQSGDYKKLIGVIGDVCKVAENNLMRGLNKSIVPVYEQAYQHKLVGQAGYISNMDILIAAVRFVTIYGSMLGTTSEDDSYTMASYSDIYRSACRVIPNIHTQIQNIIIENLDYRQLIAKYNGLPYKEHIDPETQEGGIQHEAEVEYQNVEKVYYFDPPYYVGALAKEDEGYRFAFTRDQTRAMTAVLDGSDKSYGELKYWVKSDYQPLPWDEDNKMFQSIENINGSHPEYKKFDIGTSGESAAGNKGAARSKHEYIWVKGLA